VLAALGRRKKPLPRIPRMKSMRNVTAVTVPDRDALRERLAIGFAAGMGIPGSVLTWC
jgi:hypothetical protein